MTARRETYRKRNEQRRAERRKQELQIYDERKAEQIGRFIEYSMRRGPATGALDNEFRTSAQEECSKTRAAAQEEQMRQQQQQQQQQEQQEQQEQQGTEGKEERDDTCLTFDGVSSTYPLQSLDKGIEAWLRSEDLERDAVENPEEFILNALTTLVRDSRIFCNKDLEKFNQVSSCRQAKKNCYHAMTTMSTPPPPPPPPPHSDVLSRTD